MSEPVTIGMVASVVVGILIFLVKMMINDIKSSISGVEERLSSSMEAFNNRITKVEEKHEADMKQVQTELSNIKGDFSMSFVLREDFFRTMNGMEAKMVSMDEKLNLVMTLKASIDRARYIIDNANLYCFLVTDCGWKPDYIWEILNSNVKNEIAERVINKWNQGYAG